MIVGIVGGKNFDLGVELLEVNAAMSIHNEVCYPCRLVESTFHGLNAVEAGELTEKQKYAAIVAIRERFPRCADGIHLMSKLMACVRAIAWRPEEES